MNCYNSELPIGPPGPPGPQGQQGIQGPSGELPYTIYSALLTQTGSTAPTVVVLQDTIGNISFTYEDVGLYKIENLSTTSNKVFILLGTHDNANIKISYYGPDFFGINVTDLTNTNVDGDGFATYLYKTPIEIRVYP
jgi:hypothetical protein